jgi:hypothetical protein
MINNQNIQGAQKLNSQKINDLEETGKWSEHSLFKGQDLNSQKSTWTNAQYPWCKENTNQNHVKIPLHSY